jgi:biopolymer transport protein ExbB
MSNNILQLVVEATLYTLIFLSIVTWFVIFAKSIQHVKASRQDKQFSKKFWTSSNLETALELASDNGAKARLAQAGLGALSEKNSVVNDLEHSWDRQELLERHLHQQIQRERHLLESGLSILASIGSTAPFIGLFGTVFGIIQALTAISTSASASIDVVAGPIGEALIATGIGIAVAVPAVLAYNFFLRRLKVLIADFESYATDLVNLAQKKRFIIVEKNKTRDVEKNEHANPTVQQSNGVYA